MQTNMRYTTGADPGFLVGGKLHEIEKILGNGGGGGRGHPHASATDTRKYILTFSWQGNADRKVQEGRYPASQGF